jgi:endonuclease V-like protein UPF0215 family
MRINDQDESLARKQLGKQDFVKLLVHGHEAHAGGVDAQLAEQILEKFAGVTLRLEKVRTARFVAHAFQNLVKQGRFAHTGLGD